MTLVLDTGATATSLNASLLRSLGYDPDGASETVWMTTGSGVEVVPRLTINRLSALGRHAIGLRVLAHDLPTEAAVDGLLGLDFFRALLLTLDFRSGQITLTRFHPQLRRPRRAISSLTDRSPGVLRGIPATRRCQPSAEPAPANG